MKLTDKGKALLEEARKHAKKRGDSYIDTDHLLQALFTKMVTHSLSCWINVV